MKFVKYYPLGILLSLLIASCGTKSKDQRQQTIENREEVAYIYVDEDLEWEPQYKDRIKPHPANYRLPVQKSGSLAEIFNDSNKYQYAHAERVGTRPILSFEETYHATRPLVQVKSCRYYQLSPLTHSLPFLVPGAEMLLRDIGRNFIDSLSAYGVGGYRINVTSLLRTKASVKKLRRVNKNASDSSTHQFGTTFDICWNYFATDDTTHSVNTDDMMWVLAHVLEDLRKQGRCLVKYEKKTHCFHITSTR